MNTPVIPRRRFRPVASAALVLLLPLSVYAQRTNDAPDPATLAKYDVNKDGRLDSAELGAKQAAESRSAAAATTKPDAASGETVEMSPFQVVSDDRGYQASNTLSGTRLNSRLEDLGASITVVTMQQMLDTAVLDINDVMRYEASTEGTDNFTTYNRNRTAVSYTHLTLPTNREV